ncbi:hypothetical protein [Hydrocarboniphaga effusa]|uniref:hypothetical protein n=1 Tax=Hydrocarboniphaga effusa TaxID=243629 RepID=UPI00398BF78A
MSDNNIRLRKAVQGMAARLDRVRAVVREAAEENETLADADGAMLGAYELLLSLARLLDGKSLHGAFGAPGDWGYDSDIGRALYGIYSEPIPKRSHALEPWHVELGAFLYSGCSKVADIGFAATEEDRTANAYRIVACVNACEGMDDPAKEIAALRNTGTQRLDEP